MPGSPPPLELLHPRPVTALSREELADVYAWPRELTVRFNFVSGLDGAATIRGRSGDLGSPADRCVFELLRRTADVILVGSGTVRTEGYAGPLLASEPAARSAEPGHPLHPAVAYLSRRLQLDPEAPAFRDAAVRPLVFTTAAADPRRRKALEPVADVVTAGGTDVDPRRVVRILSDAGHRRILCEGGPRVFGSFEAAEAVDELCLSLSPLLTAGSGPRLSAGAPETVSPMRLRSVIRAGDMLLLRYTRR